MTLSSVSKQHCISEQASLNMLYSVWRFFRSFSCSIQLDSACYQIFTKQSTGQSQCCQLCKQNPTEPRLHNIWPCPLGLWLQSTHNFSDAHCTLTVWSLKSNYFTLRCNTVEGRYNIFIGWSIAIHPSVLRNIPDRCNANLELVVPVLFQSLMFQSRGSGAWGCTACLFRTRTESDGHSDEI